MVEKGEEERGLAFSKESIQKVFEKSLPSL
jgi:hypothetical protein